MEPVASSESRAAAVARNALSGSGRHVVSALLALAVTPYALRVLGTERFGVWVLAGTVLLTIRTLDLGLERALVRAVARADAAGRRGEARDELIVGQRLIVAAALVPAVAILAFRDPLVARILQIPPALRPEAIIAIVGTAGVGVVEAAYRPLSAALDGVGRMDRARAIDALQRILSSIGVVVALWLGFGLAGLVVKNALTIGVAGGLYARSLRRIAPELVGRRPAGRAAIAGRGRAAERPEDEAEIAVHRLAVGRPDGRDAGRPDWRDAGRPAPSSTSPDDAPPERDRRAIARELLGFGGHVQAVALSALAYEVFVKVLLGRVAGMGAVAVYELGARVVVLVGGTLQAATEAIFPEASAREAVASSRAESRDAAVDLDWRAGRALGWLAVPAFGLVVALAEPFAVAWLGLDPARAPVGEVMRVLAAGWAIAILASPAYLIAQAAGRAADGTAAAIVTAAVAMILGAALVGRYGAVGAATGVSIGLATGAGFMWWRFERAFGGGRSVARIVDPRALAATALAMLAARGTLAGLAEIGGVTGDRIASSLLGVLGAGVIGCAVYVGAMLASGAIGAEERRLMGRVFGRAAFRRPG